MTYHDGEGERHDGDGPHGAEAGEDGEEQVVAGLLSAGEAALRDGAGPAGERGARRAHGQGAGAAAQPRALLLAAAGLGVQRLGGHVGHQRGRVARRRADAVTWRRRGTQVEWKPFFVCFCNPFSPPVACFSEDTWYALKQTLGEHANSRQKGLFQWKKLLTFVCVSKCINATTQKFVLCYKKMSGILNLT